MTKLNLYLIIAALVFAITGAVSIASCSHQKSRANIVTMENAMLITDTGHYYDRLGRLHNTVVQFTIERATLMGELISRQKENELLRNMIDYYKNLAKNKQVGTVIGMAQQTTGQIITHRSTTTDSGTIVANFADRYMSGTYIEFINNKDTTRILEYETKDTIMVALNRRIKQPIITWRPFHIQLFNRAVHYEGDFFNKNPRAKITGQIMDVKN